MDSRKNDINRKTVELTPEDLKKLSEVEQQLHEWEDDVVTAVDEVPLPPMASEKWFDLFKGKDNNG